MTAYVELVALAVWLVIGFFGTIFTPGEDKAYVVFIRLLFLTFSLGRVLIWTTVICTFA